MFDRLAGDFVTHFSWVISPDLRDVGSEKAIRSGQVRACNGTSPDRLDSESTRERAERGDYNGAAVVATAPGRREEGPDTGTRLDSESVRERAERGDCSSDGSTE